MEVFLVPEGIRTFTRSCRARGETVAFVPTMGALHDGHLSLVARAREECDRVVLSIFVNPLQFNVDSDFDRYPRTMEEDLAMARAGNVDAVYTPSVGTVYPEGFDTTVHVGRTAEPLEGAGRPGHFDGVATVVTKLLTAVEPDVAVFGEKDYQQLAVVRRLVVDLGLPVRIVGAPTVRESDGLAMSSRNARLTPAARLAAPVIKRGLDAAAARLRQVSSPRTAREEFASVVSSEPAARIEYVSVADSETLQELDSFGRTAVVSCAVWFDDVRLIDNVVVEP